jgi:tRNA pseudouridine38-40 synthase
VKEAAPGRGLCLLRAGYQDEIFSQAGWYDGQPSFFLADCDPPPDPPPLPKEQRSRISDDPII